MFSLIIEIQVNTGKFYLKRTPLLPKIIRCVFWQVAIRELTILTVKVEYNGIKRLKLVKVLISAITIKQNR